MITNDTEYAVDISGTINALNGTVDLTSSNHELVQINLTGTWVGTLTFEGTVDGTTYFTIAALNRSTLATATTTTANAQFLLPSAALKLTRVRASAWTSGTVTVTASGSDISNVQYSIQGGTWTVRLQGNGGTVAEVTANRDVKTADTINASGLEATLSLGTTATLAKVGASNLANRKLLTVHNNSNSIIYWGFTSGVTTSTGTPILKGQMQTWAINATANIYLIAPSAGNDVRITEAP